MSHSIPLTLLGYILTGEYQRIELWLYGFHISDSKMKFMLTHWGRDKMAAKRHSASMISNETLRVLIIINVTCFLSLHTFIDTVYDLFPLIVHGCYTFTSHNSRADNYIYIYQRHHIEWPCHHKSIRQMGCGHPRICIVSSSWVQHGMFRELCLPSHHWCTCAIKSCYMEVMAVGITNIALDNI